MAHIVTQASMKRRHTSVVVFGKEVFYGQGIAITPPGQSHVRASIILASCYV